MFLTEEESYKVSYEQRCLQTYQPGDKVRVGPAYQGGGYYSPDDFDGTWYVVRSVGPADYKLSRRPSTQHWDFICHASRLELANP